MVNDRLPARLMRTVLCLGTVTALVASCGKGTEGPTSTMGTSSVTSTTTAVVVDRDATRSGWVPVAFDNVQISVPATWDVTFGCPHGTGSVYLGGPPKMFCPEAAASPNVVVIDTDASPPPKGVAPEIINGITVYRLTPDDGTVLIPSMRVSVDATGPSADEVLHTVTYAPRAVALSRGSYPRVPRSWHRVSFGGLSAAVPRTWPIEDTSRVPFGCSPLRLSLGVTGVVLSAGTTGSAFSCAATSYVTVPIPVDGLIIDPGRFGPIPAGASFGTCMGIHRLQVCPTTVDRYGVLVLSVRLPGRPRTTSVEIGLAGSGLIARIILGSLRPA